MNHTKPPKSILCAAASTPGLSASSPGNGQPVEATDTGSPAAVAEGAGVSAHDRAAAMLGREGCGLMFALYSELKPGMRWEYMLMSMSCNALGQPVKVYP